MYTSTLPPDIRKLELSLTKGANCAFHFQGGATQSPERLRGVASAYLQPPLFASDQNVYLYNLICSFYSFQSYSYLIVVAFSISCMFSPK